MSTELRAVDPLGNDHGDATARHLHSARRVLETRLADVIAGSGTFHGRRPSGWRVWVAGAALAVLLPVALVVIVPELTGRFGLSQLTGSAVGTATADGGGTAGLTCGGGTSRAIRPDQAPVRLWPTALPPGWRVRQVFANATTGYGWCTEPSLVLADANPDGTVTGVVRVTGPGRDIRLGDDDRTAPDTVAGLPARRLLPEHGLGAVGDPVMQRWVVTDADNSDWYIEALGYPRAVARQVLSGLQLAGSQVTWSHQAAPGLRVLHQRTAAPYPLVDRRGTDWVLRVADESVTDRWLALGTHEPSTHWRQVEVWLGRPGGVSGYVTPGSRLLSVGARPAVLMRDAGRDHALYVDVAPGVQAVANVRDDLPAVEAMLASLTDLDTDDPRLDRFALPRGRQ